MAYAPAALRWLAEQWENAIGSAVFSGIVGDAAHTYGYHRAANEIPRSDYSRQLAGDRDIDGIDMYAADAIDMNMSRADMIAVTKRVYASWRDQNDPRLNYWREIIGTLDGVNVIYMDCQSGEQGTADDTHLWHMHAGGLRIHANNMDAMRALLSVVKGETVAQWQAGDDDMDQTEKNQLLRADAYGYALVTGASETIPIPDHTGKVITLPVAPNLKLAAIEDRLAAIEDRLADPVDEAALAAQLVERLQPLAPGATVEQVREILAGLRLVPGA